MSRYIAVPSVRADRRFHSVPRPLVYDRHFVSLFVRSPPNVAPGTPSVRYKRAQASRRRERAQEKRRLRFEVRRASREARKAEQEEGGGARAGGATREVVDASVDHVAGGKGSTAVGKVEVVTKEVGGEKDQAWKGAEGDAAHTSEDGSLPSLPVQVEVVTVTCETARFRSSPP